MMGRIYSSGQGYKAWGEKRYSTGVSPLPTTFRYSQDRRDAEGLGLYYYGAKVVRRLSLTARNQPDSIIPDPGNSLDWDRYSFFPK